MHKEVQVAGYEFWAKVGSGKGLNVIGRRPAFMANDGHYNFAMVSMQSLRPAAYFGLLEDVCGSLY